MLRIVPIFSACVLLLSLSTASAQEAAKAESPAEFSTRVKRLIEQLGNEDYTLREKAQAELSRLGLTAFDALIEAQDNPSVEIALRAKYLVRGLQVWIREDDPNAVKSILRDYGRQETDRRTERIDRLAALPERQGWEALCRIVRYEADERTAKHAALAIVKTPAPSPDKLAAAVAVLNRGVGENERGSVKWVRAYVAMLTNPTDAVDRWTKLVDEESDAAVAGSHHTSPELAKELTRWHAQNLRRLGRLDEAVAMARRSLHVLERSSDGLSEHVNWLAQSEFWPLIVETAEKYDTLFTFDAGLLYRKAEALLRTGKTEAADEVAKAALALNQGVAPSRLEMGTLLQERGLFDWSEREFRDLMATEKLESIYNLYAHFQLSEMLHDQMKDLAAAEVLRAAVATIDANDKVREMLTDRGRDPEATRSRMHYFQAMHHQASGEGKKAVEELEKGLLADETDVDVLIAVYRLTDRTPAEREHDMQRLREAIKSFREEVAHDTQQLQNAQQQGGMFEKELKHQLAIAHNQYAWLVGNTEGDLDGAIASSHESLKLRPKTAAYYDTLGRCYYTKGDFENAIKYQGEALKLDPHSGQMQRQMEMFKRAAKKG